MDRDDRPDVEPEPEPDDPMRETHAHDDTEGGYHDGSSEDMDTQPQLP